ncbi:MAG TPA: hypothetical protein VG796_22795 [Verrucomicrobiales bacterium]|jgi:hypothetical protein|nr:hypothetical protein [Verrucomicrobiales bacterium]
MSILDPRAFEPSRRHADISRTGRKQQMPVSVFHPAGRLCDDGESSFDIYYWSAPDNNLDDAWLAQAFPTSEAMQDILATAFEQYCGEDHAGNSMREDVLEYLRDFKGESAVAAFKGEGYLPFVKICMVYLIRDHDAVVISAMTDIDYNLDEHGILILIHGGKITFGYDGDFTEFLE